MIESEDKRKRLTDILEHWAEHTKVKPYLRNHDIPGLVGSILEEFYHTRLCCGHLVASHEDGVVLTFKDWEDGERVEIQGTYCKECAKRLRVDEFR